MTRLFRSPPPSPSRVSKLNKIPPGVPPGPPPELSGEEDEGFEEIHNRSSESDDSDKESRKKKRKGTNFYRKISFLKGPLIHVIFALNSSQS